MLNAGDTLVITDLDRLSRRTARIILTLDNLTARKITVESLYENVDTSTADGLFSVTILGALAQRERDRIAERTRAGLEAARARGRHHGRPVAVTPEQYETALMLRDLGKSYRQVAASTGVSASTAARICRGETPGHQRYRRRIEEQSTLTT
ncbi:recombinase family protein [Brachybacterium vulturis]|uniref:recombinase family protein n=1 Tax=Brachybacterium vulturis TaxID=2017484 RepID=UPI00373553A6